MKKIGLSMIVKDEARVIERCLNSVKPLLDYVLIEDTGSTDGTQDIIRAWLDRNGIDGTVVEEPWRDFAYNRSHALACLRKRKDVDYALIIDADDTMFVDDDLDIAALKRSLVADSYELEIRQPSITYWRQQLCSNKIPYRYRGVLHEFLESDVAGTTSARLPGVYMNSGRDGARSQNRDKYLNDAQTLEKALELETDPFMRSRYQFYLAQSYRDCGRAEQAIKNYQVRAGLGYWQDEVFVSLYEVAKLKEALQYPADEVIAAYEAASVAHAGRAEALYAAAKFCRMKDRFEQGYEFAKRGLAIAKPTAGLFVEQWGYVFGLADELAVCAYWTGRYRESFVAGMRALRHDKLDAATRQRAEANVRFARDKAAATGKLYQVGDRVVMITPYFKESREYLERCIESVKRQTIPTDHYLVADGFPQDWIDGTGVRHIRLDRNSADYGDTPRGIGAMLAISAGYDAIGLLDADCWLEPDHVETCFECANMAAEEPDFVVARVKTLLPDGTPIPAVEESVDTHIDTNSYLMLSGGHRFLSAWTMVPRQLAVVCDRVIFAGIKAQGAEFSVCSSATVNYTTTWLAHYKMMGLTPPPEAKANPDHIGCARWIENLSERDFKIYSRRLGFPLDTLYGWMKPRQPTVATAWAPATPMGGTEIMVNTLASHLGAKLKAINLVVNDEPTLHDGRPLVVWIHHDVDQDAIQWIHDKAKTNAVHRFVFVSDWQRARFVTHFGLNPTKCVTLRNATDVPAVSNDRTPGLKRKFAYTSTPFRGLSVLLDAWELMDRPEAELHIWSSMKLYGPDIDDSQFQALYAKAKALPNVFYHGIAPNAELRQALKDIDVLAYPSTFRETSCLSVVEAMAAGCRILCPDLGALKETCGGFNRGFPAGVDHESYVRDFAKILQEEMTTPWGGDLSLREKQVEFTRNTYDWSVRTAQWEEFISSLAP